MNSMRSAVSCGSAPFMRTVRCFTVANTLSIGISKPRSRGRRRPERRLPPTRGYGRLKDCTADNYFSKARPTRRQLSPSIARLRSRSATGPNEALRRSQRSKTPNAFPDIPSIHAPELGRLLDSEWTRASVAEQVFAADSIKNDLLRMMCYALSSDPLA